MERKMTAIEDKLMKFIEKAAKDAVYLLVDVLETTHEIKENLVD